MWLLAPGAWGKRCMAYLSGDQRSQLGGSLCGGFYVGACPVIRLCTGLLFYFWNEIRAPRGDKWLVFWWKGDKWGCSVVTVGRGVVSRDWIKGSYQWSLLIGAICQWFSDQKICTVYVLSNEWRTSATLPCVLREVSMNLLNSIAFSIPKYRQNILW